MKNLFDITIKQEDFVVIKGKKKSLKEIREELDILGAKYE